MGAESHQPVAPPAASPAAISPSLGQLEAAVAEEAARLPPDPAALPLALLAKLEGRLLQRFGVVQFRDLTLSPGGGQQGPRSLLELVAARPQLLAGAALGAVMQPMDELELCRCWGGEAREVRGVCACMGLILAPVWICMPAACMGAWVCGWVGVCLSPHVDGRTCACVFFWLCLSEWK